MLKVKLDLEFERTAIDLRSITRLTMQILEQDEDTYPREFYRNDKENIKSVMSPQLHESGIIFLRGGDTTADNHKTSMEMSIEAAKKTANRLKRIGAEIIANFEWDDNTIIIEKRGEFL